MPSRYTRKQRLDSLFEKTTQIDDAEVGGHWARYLCIQTYGYLERCFIEIVEDYCRSASCGRTFAFVSHRLKYINNVSPGTIEELLMILDKNWHEKFMHKYKKSIERDHLASIVNNRNKIAHGEDTGITISTMVSYRKSVDHVLDNLEKLVS